MSFRTNGRENFLKFFLDYYPYTFLDLRYIPSSNFKRIHFFILVFMNFFYIGAIPSPKVKRTQQNNGTHMPTDSSKKANNSATHYACPQVNIHTLNNIIILFG